MGDTLIGKDVHRQGRRLTDEEFEARLNATPDKIEWVGGIFDSDRRRLAVLGMLLEILGADAALEFGDLDVREAAMAARRAVESSHACAS